MKRRVEVSDVIHQKDAENTIEETCEPGGLLNEIGNKDTYSSNPKEITEISATRKEERALG